MPEVMDLSADALPTENLAAYVRRMQWSGPVVLKVTATWCVPCRGVAPIVAELAKEHSRVPFYNVDVDRQPRLATLLEVRSVPTVLVLVGSRVVDMKMGAQSRVALAEWMRNALTKARQIPKKD